MKLAISNGGHMAIRCQDCSREYRELAGVAGGLEEDDPDEDDLDHPEPVPKITEWPAPRALQQRIKDALVADSVPLPPAMSDRIHQRNAARATGNAMKEILRKAHLARLSEPK